MFLLTLHEKKAWCVPGQQKIVTIVGRFADASSPWRKFNIWLDLLFHNRRQEPSRNKVVVLVTPQILDDSDRSPYGYNYLRVPEVHKFLQQFTPKPQGSSVQPPFIQPSQDGLSEQSIQLSKR